MGLRTLVCVAVIVFGVGSSQAGWLEESVQSVGKRLGQRGVNETGNSAYDAVKGGIKDTVKGDKEAPKPASPQPAPAAGQTTASAEDGQAAQAAASAGGTSDLDEAEKVLTKFDFVPGDKVIFFDDFSDTDVGEFPRKWTFDGPKAGANNTVDVVEWQGKRFLRSVPGAKNQPPATQYLRLEQKGDFPEKFTIEFDAVFNSINNSPVYYVAYRVLFVPQDMKNVNLFKNSVPNSLLISGQDNFSANTQTKVELNDGKVHHVAISVNGTFVKAYIDNQRVINDPDALKRPLKQLGLQLFTPNNFKSESLLFTNFRLAEGGKDVKAALDTEGRIVTHGILFDTGKDVLKPESLPTLKMILGLLANDPSLQFSIEGHTDNQGDKGVNQPLSERRAQAVARWLERKGIDASRLKTAGFGDTKPLDSNATPEGRANNRRVEFVKF